jgi:nitrogen fixation/metabolism regulation signal transduction histidine kinase
MRLVTGGIRRRLAFVIVLTALIPSAGAIWLARSMIEQAIARFYMPEVGEQLDRALSLHTELAREAKAVLRQQAATIAESAALQQAVQQPAGEPLQQLLRDSIEHYPSLVSLQVLRSEEPLARADRGTPLDSQREHELVVLLPLPGQEDVQLEATFAAERARFAGVEEMNQVVGAYRALERRRESDEGTYLRVFAALLVGTLLFAFVVGGLIASGAVRKLRNLASATRQVGAGDLSIRVPADGSDEIADLARSFNRMVSEVETSRARIDYLQRIATWQEMARRLAHEIKNPLTPIQLAIQELHQRYQDGNEEFRKLLDTTVEIVDAEVGTLRRLVGEFSGFARLPTAHLMDHDLWGLLRAEQAHFELLAQAPAGENSDFVLGPNLDLRFEIPAGDAQAALDPQLFRRALHNLIRNAAQALEGRAGGGHIVVRGQAQGNVLRVLVDDDGPGIPESARRTIFDPYVTHKAGGTGLGLAIVKKVIMEHHGRIEATLSPLGGARLSIELPRAAAMAVSSDLAATEQVTS